MYIAKHFELAPERVSELLTSAVTAEVVAAYPEGPEATLLPVSYEADADGGLGSLVAHVTRTNDLWKRTPLGEVLAIVSGPDAYVSPTWFPGYPERAEVPTWNYVTVHAYGQLIVHDDDAWCRSKVARLSASHGYDVDQVDERSMELMLRSIVGIELKLTRVLGKGKLSQNKSTEFLGSVIAGLSERGGAQDEALASAMTQISVPHAAAREELVAGIRAEHQLGFAAPVDRG